MLRSGIHGKRSDATTNMMERSMVVPWLLTIEIKIRNSRPGKMHLYTDVSSIEGKSLEIKSPST